MFEYVLNKHIGYIKNNLNNCVYRPPNALLENIPGMMFYEGYVIMVIFVILSFIYMFQTIKYLTIPTDRWGPPEAEECEDPFQPADKTAEDDL